MGHDRNTSRFPDLPRARMSQYRKLEARKSRRESGLFLAEGIRAVEQLLDQGRIAIEAIIWDGISEDVAGRVSGLFDGPVFRADAPQFAELSDTGQSQGLIAVCRIPEPVSYSTFLDIRQGFLLAADAVQDPGNFGTLIRSAAWFGASGVLAGRGTVDVWNPKTVRSTAGSLGAMPVAEADLSEILPEFSHRGWEIILLDVGGDAVSVPGSGIQVFGQSDGPGGSNETGVKSASAETIVPVPNAHPHSRTILVVGNEGNGISAGLKSAGYRRMFIPGRSDRVESLNVSVAAGIAMHALGGRGGEG